MAARPRFAVCVHAAPSCVDCSPLILHLKCGRYSKAYHRVCKLGVRKYFEHAGALITADGTGDERIKLEGVPKGHTFTF